MELIVVFIVGTTLLGLLANLITIGKFLVGIIRFILNVMTFPVRLVARWVF